MKRTSSEVPKVRSYRLSVQGYALLTCALALFVPLQAVDASSKTQGTGWSQYGFDAAHASYNEKDTAISSSNVGSLVQAWSYPLGASNDVYNVFETAGLAYAVAQDGVVSALNTSSGVLAWSFATGIIARDVVTSSVAVDGGNIYTPCVRYAPTEAMCALNAETGAYRWSFPLPGSLSFIGAPAVKDGTVYFQGCSTACAMYALSEKTGFVQWATLLPSSCGAVGDPPTIAGTRIFDAMTCGSEPLVFEAQVAGGGNPNAFSADGVIEGITASSKLVYVSSWLNQRTFVTTYSVSDIVGEWFAEGESLTSAPAPALSAVADGLAYASAAGQFLVFRHQSRKIQWIAGSASSEAAVANGVLYTDWNGVTAALPARSYAPSPLWEAGGSPGLATPIIADGAVYGACNSTNVCKWNLPSRRQAEMRNGARR